MQIRDYQDERGRSYRVELPDDSTDREAEYGILVGPPDIVDVLSLPEAVATRLHNELFRREIWNADIARKNPSLLAGALQKALLVDVQKLLQAYVEYEREEPLEEGDRLHTKEA